MATLSIPDETYRRICRKFAERMRTLRLEFEEQQLEFGRRFGVGQSSISRWETALCIPRIRKLTLISDRLLVSVDWLLGFGEERMRPDAITRLVERAKA